MAAWAALQGRWSEAEQGFEQVLAELKGLQGKRKGLLPELVALPYVLALLAQGSPVHLERALKFCLAESGKRQASADSGWGLIALAIQVRRGDNRLDLGSFKPLSDQHHVYRIDLWRWLMRAWLKTGSDAIELHPREQDAAQRLRQRLHALGLDGAGRSARCRAGPIASAADRAGLFCRGQSGRLAAALAELATLGGAGASGSVDAEQTNRLLWVLDIGSDGRVRDLQPFEQKRGPRGWGKPRDVSLSQAGQGRRAGAARRGGGDGAAAVAVPASAAIVSIWPPRSSRWSAIRRSNLPMRPASRSN